MSGFVGYVCICLFVCLFVLFLQVRAAKMRKFIGTTKLEQKRHCEIVSGSCAH